MKMKLSPIKCYECNKVVAYRFLQDDRLEPHAKQWCYLCAHSICDTAEELKIWGGHPNRHELYAIKVGHDNPVELRGKFLRTLQRLQGD